MQTAQEMRTRIIDKAVADADYRAKLLDDPRTAIGGELGVSIPEAFNIHVHEEGTETAHLVLPPSSKLSDRELESVTAGARAQVRHTLFGQEVDIGLDW